MNVEESKIKYKYGTESLDDASNELRSKGPMPSGNIFMEKLF